MELTETIDPFTFAGWLRKGLGRAILYLRQHDSAPYAEAIRHACLHHLAYDRQCECTREQYLFDLIQATGQALSYRDLLIDTLRTRNPDCDLWQVFGILRVGAQNGDGFARAIVYQAFEEDWTGNGLGDADEMVALDGIDGLLRVVKRYPPSTIAEDDAWQLTSLVAELGDRDGTAEAQSALATAAETNRLAREFLEWYSSKDSEREHRWRNRSGRPLLSFAEIERLVREADPANWYSNRGSLMSAGRRADDETINLAAEALIHETDEHRLTRWIQLFGRREFPRDPTRIIARTYDADEQFRFDAGLALSNVEHADVRARAIEAASRPGNEWLTARLLESNYQSSDDIVITDMLRRPLDDHALHSICMSVRHTAKTRPVSVPVLLVAYEKSPCSFCRNSVVDILLTQDDCPAWIREEAVWDCVSDTRNAVSTTSTPH